MYSASVFEVCWKLIGIRVIVPPSGRKEGDWLNRLVNNEVSLMLDKVSQQAWSSIIIKMPPFSAY